MSSSKNQCRSDREAVPLFRTMPEFVVGVGNTGRADDGLGWAFLDALADIGFPGRLEYRYQLQVEDAELISQHQSILIVDATREPDVETIGCYKIQPSPTPEFTTHALDPSAIAHIVSQLYGRYPDIRLLVIKGSEWGLKEGLSQSARANLDFALRFFTHITRDLPRSV